MAGMQRSVVAGERHGEITSLTTAQSRESELEVL